MLHEPGHNHNLRYGETENKNCRPSYISVMNFNLQGGTSRLGGGLRLDYSPPRQAIDGPIRDAAPLATLIENAPNEAVPIDPLDPANQTIFMNSASLIVTAPLAATPDYNRDLADAPLEIATVNIDNGIAGVPPMPNTGAPGCANGTNNDTLNGANDWSQVNLKFRQFADSGDGVTGADGDGAATDEELQQIDIAIHTTEFALGAERRARSGGGGHQC